MTLVTHATYHLVKYAGFDQFFTDLIHFSMILSAYCHDVDHTGSTNNFEIAKQSKLALRYNDKSVNIISQNGLIDFNKRFWNSTTLLIHSKQ